MKARIVTLTGFLIVAVTALGTVAQGYLTNRWNSADEKLAQAGAALTHVPTEFGEWSMQSETPFEPRIQQILNYAGAVNRVYVHSGTNQSVAVALIAGPPGETSTHTAEMCYSSRGHEMLSDTETPTLEVDGTSNQFRRVLMENKSVDGRRLEVMYGWRFGDAWEAPMIPRAYYGARPFLFKVQIASEFDASEKGEGEATTPCQQFLRDFVPALNRQVFTKVNFE
jgi:hypothetical protein